MTSPVFSETALALTAELPPAKGGPGYRTVLVNSYSPSALTPDETIEIPLYLNSREFLVFAHFEEDVADKIWQAWCNKDPSTRGHLIDDARLYIKETAKSYDAVGEDDDWDEALKKLGWCKEWRDGILVPKYKDLRLSQPASSWVAKDLEQAFYFLRIVSSRMEQTLEQSRLVNALSTAQTRA